jgi:16S rRNA (guanine527-N7)-methyltransferase
LTIYLSELALELGITLSEKQLLQFSKYKNLLLEWNSKMNLTAITDEKEIVVKHFIDCLALAKYSNLKPDSTVIDVGTGAGFPGIPIKILYPELKITLLDSLNKRINFLQVVVDELELENVELIHGRAEDFGQDVDYREKFEYCLSRAVASLNILTEYSLPFIEKNGYFVPMKSEKTEEEIKNAENALKVLGGEIKGINKFNIPGSSDKRTTILIKKVGDTPSKYPRKAGKPTKSPL